MNRIRVFTVLAFALIALVASQAFAGAGFYSPAKHTAQNAGAIILVQQGGSFSPNSLSIQDQWGSMGDFSLRAGGFDDQGVRTDTQGNTIPQAHAPAGGTGPRPMG